MYRIGDGLEVGTINWEDRIDMGDQCKVIEISKERALEGRDRRLIDKSFGAFPILPRERALVDAPKHQLQSS